MKDTKLKNFNPMALREKHSVSNRTNNYSSFWLDSGWDNNTSIFDNEEKKKGVDLIALASYRRAISNFVSIVTGESNIKVNFTATGDSYTNGKEVTISSKLDDKLFDSTVGLALHEGSHIKLSDFDFLKRIENEIPTEYYIRAEAFGFEKYDVVDKIKNLLNYVEDRRIDYFVFTNSPGYKGYYHSMYEKYFHSKIIDKALVTDEYTDKDWDSYIFRIINLTNKNSNLDVLPGLREIHSLIFKNVKNLDSTEDAFGVALKVFHILMDNLEVPTPNQSQENESGDESEGSESGEGSEAGEGSKEISDEEFNQALENGVGEGNGDGEGSKVELTEAQKKQLQNAIDKQKKFMNGNIAKKKLSKRDKGQLDTVESSGMSYVDVAGATNVYTNKKNEIVDPQSGSIIVMDIHNGEILCSVSSPGFNPNIFSNDLNLEDWNKLKNNAKAPFLNRSMSGVYPPGSTIKMAVALAGLESGIIDYKTSFFCTGNKEFGTSNFHCWSKNGHGKLSLIEAIEQSCDVYFYELGLKVGIDRIAIMLKKLGLGEYYNIEIDDRTKGVVPNLEWKLKRDGIKWTPGETLNASIGQGYILSTPLQLVTMVARIANGKFAIEPTLIIQTNKKKFKDLNINHSHLNFHQNKNLRKYKYRSK